MLFVRSATELLVETIYSSACIDQLLLAGEKRMALRANFNGDVLFGRTGFNNLTARTFDSSGTVIGMDSSFHVFHLAYIKRNLVYNSIVHVKMQ